MVPGLSTNHFDGTDTCPPPKATGDQPRGVADTSANGANVPVPLTRRDATAVLTAPECFTLPGARVGAEVAREAVRLAVQPVTTTATTNPAAAARTTTR